MIEVTVSATGLGTHIQMPPPENNHQLRTNIQTHVRNALGAQFGNATVIAAEIIGTGAGAVVRIKFNNVPDDGTTLLKAALR